MDKDFAGKGLNLFQVSVSVWLIALIDSGGIAASDDTPVKSEDYL